MNSQRVQKQVEGAREIERAAGSVGETPRTDKEARKVQDGIAFSRGEYVGAAFARKLERELKREKHAYDAAVNSNREYLRSMMAAILDTIGGIVEGSPTHELNYLQRLRELVKAEREVAELKEKIAALMGGKCTP